MFFREIQSAGSWIGTAGAQELTPSKLERVLDAARWKGERNFLEQRRDVRAIEFG